MSRILILFLLLFNGCVLDEMPKDENLPINPADLIYKKGDCLVFYADSGRYIAAIVADYAKDKGGLWYGISFTDYLAANKPSIADIASRKLYGRKVENGSDSKGYVIGLDAVYINDSCMKNSPEKVVVIGSIKLDTTKMYIASEETVDHYSEIIASFKNGRALRLLTPDNYKKHWKPKGFRPDEYLPVADFIIK